MPLRTARNSGGGAGYQVADWLDWTSSIREGALIVLFGTGAFSKFRLGFPGCHHAAASILSVDLLDSLYSPMVSHTMSLRPRNSFYRLMPMRVPNAIMHPTPEAGSSVEQKNGPLAASSHASWRNTLQGYSICSRQCCCSHLATNPKHGNGGGGDFSKLFLQTYPKPFAPYTQDSVWAILKGEALSPGDTAF